MLAASVSWLSFTLYFFRLSESETVVMMGEGREVVGEYVCVLGGWI